MEPPQPPSNLRSTVSNAGAVTLAWNDNSDNETGFYLYRWDGSIWFRIATLGANATTYTDTDPNAVRVAIGSAPTISPVSRQ